VDEKKQIALQMQPSGADDIPDARTAPVLAGAEATAPERTAPRSTPDQAEDSPRARTGVQANDFLTFDPTRKHLARVVEVKGKRLTVRRFDKKSGKWLTKLEPRERNSGIWLSPEEADKSFPGCVAAWAELSGEHAPPAQQSIAATKKMSPEGDQYLMAIAMSSADLGAILTKPTERITKHVGKAIAHETLAKTERAEAQREFSANVAFYYEAKQRLLNPGYRTDVDGGKDRTPDENQKNFGAPDWAAFNKNCAAYSLQHADRKLKAFAKEQNLLTDDGDNIDDPEPENDEPEAPEPRRTPDATAQKRYEHVATAAMAIASRNPEGEIEQQILAAADYVPVPHMPLPPDVFTEVLSFITKISSSVTDEGVRDEAKKLLGKMLLHKPTPDPADVLAEASDEEKRKRTKRLARKNGQALGSSTYNPPTNGTSEDVQRSMDGAQAEAGCIAGHEGKDREQEEGTRAATSTTALTYPMEAEPASQEDPTRSDASPAEHTAAPEGATGETPDHGKRTNEGQSTESTQPKEEQALFYKKRVLRMDGEEIIDYPVFKRGGDDLPEDVFDTEADAQTYIAKGIAGKGAA
jgi:hypothetical protein